MAYETENLVGGAITTQQVKFVADTYYKGMPLEYDSANDRYRYLASGSLAGFFLEDVSRTLINNDWGSIISGGEIQEAGIVTDLNAAYTVSEDLIAAWAALGYKIKRK